VSFEENAMNSNNPNRIDQQTPARMSTTVTVGRQTAKTDFGDRVQAGLNAAASAVSQGAALAAPLLPGSSIVSAAVSGITNMTQNTASGAVAGGAYGQYQGSLTTTVAGANLGGTGMGTGSSTPTQGTGSGGDAALAHSMDENREMLNLQIAMQRENTVFTTVSNVLKVRHDTVKNSISNVR
jgi:hypothetical protein